jgi:coenzyme F420-reducing hydrogenase gamma subunit
MGFHPESLIRPDCESPELNGCPPREQNVATTLKKIETIWRIGAGGVLKLEVNG